MRVVAHMYTKTKEFSEKHGLRVALEESPAESAARRLAKSDLVYYKKEAEEVIRGSIDDDSVYYTNSIHLTADADVGLVGRIKEQAKFHSMIESGAITHAFVGEEKPSWESILKLVKDTFYRTQTAQLTVSPEFTMCNDCQYIDRGIHETCRKCSSKNVIGETRVVGYFSKVANWNKSKRLGELKDRQKGNYSVETGVSV
jgi:ribonucleoside-triphosphate reductase